MDMIQNNGKLNESYLQAFEGFLGSKFPNAYRKFLLDYNGGEPLKTIFFFKNESLDGSIVDRFFGFVPEKYSNILIYFRDYRERIPLNMFPIGYDPGGNLILISMKGPDRGKIYFWDHEMESYEDEEPDYSNLTLIADDFDEFINSLRSPDDEKSSE